MIKLIADDHINEVAMTEIWIFLVMHLKTPVVS